MARAEMLLLLAGLMFFGALLVPAWIDWLHHKRTRQAYADIVTLVAAARQYHTEYRTWPVPWTEAKGDLRFGLRRSNEPVVAILRGEDRSGRDALRTNPLEIDFFAAVNRDVRTLRFNRHGEVIDPWGTPYQLVFDTNYDLICVIENSAFPPVRGIGVVVWSMGPDRRSETADDLTSWRRIE